VTLAFCLAGASSSIGLQAAGLGVGADGYSSETAKNGKSTSMTTPRNTATPPMTAINSKEDKGEQRAQADGRFFPTEIAPLEQKANVR
jgi:hypothetical protein